MNPINLLTATYHLPMEAGELYHQLLSTDASYCRQHQSYWLRSKNIVILAQGESYEIFLSNDLGAFVEKVARIEDLLNTTKQGLLYWNTMYQCSPEEIMSNGIQLCKNALISSTKEYYHLLGDDPKQEDIHLIAAILMAAPKYTSETPIYYLDMYYNVEPPKENVTMNMKESLELLCNGIGCTLKECCQHYTIGQRIDPKAAVFTWITACNEEERPCYLSIH